MTLRTLNYGNYGIFLIMGNAGFCPSTIVPGPLIVTLLKEPEGTPRVASTVQSTTRSKSAGLAVITVFHGLGFRGLGFWGLGHIGFRV